MTEGAPFFASGEEKMNDYTHTHTAETHKHTQMVKRKIQTGYTGEDGFKYAYTTCPDDDTALGVRGSGGLISALIRSENGDGVQCCAAGG